jgi:hypothetical protein
MYRLQIKFDYEKKYISVFLISEMIDLKLFSISPSSRDPCTETIKVVLAGTAGGWNQNSPLVTKAKIAFCHALNFDVSSKAKINNYFVSYA